MIGSNRSVSKQDGAPSRLGSVPWSTDMSQKIEPFVFPTSHPSTWSLKLTLRKIGCASRMNPNGLSSAMILICRRLGHPAASHCSLCHSLLHVGRG